MLWCARSLHAAEPRHRRQSRTHRRSPSPGRARSLAKATWTSRSPWRQVLLHPRRRHRCADRLARSAPRFGGESGGRADILHAERIPRARRRQPGRAAAPASVRIPGVYAASQSRLPLARRESRMYLLLFDRGTVTTVPDELMCLSNARTFTVQGTFNRFALDSDQHHRRCPSRRRRLPGRHRRQCGQFRALAGATARRIVGRSPSPVDDASTCSQYDAAVRRPVYPPCPADLEAERLYGYLRAPLRFDAGVRQTAGVPARHLRQQLPAGVLLRAESCLGRRRRAFRHARRRASDGDAGHLPRRD